MFARLPGVEAGALSDVGTVVGAFGPIEFVWDDGSPGMTTCGAGVSGGTEDVS